MTKSRHSLFVLAATDHSKEWDVRIQEAGRAGEGCAVVGETESWGVKWQAEKRTKLEAACREMGESSREGKRKGERGF